MHLTRLYLLHCGYITDGFHVLPCIVVITWLKLQIMVQVNLRTSNSIYPTWDKWDKAVLIPVFRFGIKARVNVALNGKMENPNHRHKQN